MAKAVVVVKERTEYTVIHIEDEGGQHLFNIQATDKGIRIIGLADVLGDMAIKPRSGNSIDIIFAQNTLL